MHDAITERLDLWTSALLVKSTAGRGRNGKLEAYGIKKLRELILELAVRGKLLPQDPNDELASILLRRVVSEKAQMIDAGQIKKSKKFPSVTKYEMPFDLPVNWVWARINDVGHDWGQKTPEGSFTYIDVSAIDSDTGVISAPSILSASDAPSRARKLVMKGTVLYSTVRPYLKNICVIEDDYSPEPIASTAFAILHPFQKMPGKFYAIYFRSPQFVKYVESVQTGIAYPAINDKQFYGGLVPIPPLAEQHRIVAKVDELMALCDRLEQQQSDSIEAHQTLVETLLGTLTRAASHDEFAEAWTRIAEHFDTLFTTEHSIDQLKQTILQLAVMGKLVPQDPNDEPASVLLNRIEAEKKRLIDEGCLKKEKQLPPVSGEEMEFPLPTGWAWIKFGVISEFINGDRSKNYPNRSEYVEKGVPWINTGHIEPDGTLATEGMNYISREKYDSLSGGKIKSNDLVYCLRGATFGKTAFVTPYDEGAIASSLMIVRPFVDEMNQYIFKYLISPFGKKQLFRFDNGSAQPNLSAGNVKLYACPLPPLAEQGRIVAKVDELMALCDRLKMCLGNVQTTQVQLADAVVEQAVV